MLNRFVHLLDRHSKLILFMAAVTTAGLGYGIGQLKFSITLNTSALPESNELVRSVRRVSDTFGENTKQIIISLEAESDPAGHGILTPENLQLVTRLSDALKTVPTIKRRDHLICHDCERY